MECFQTQNFWPLHGGAFFLINPIGRIVEGASRRVFFFSIAVFALFIYGVRGFKYRNAIWGDDLKLYFSAKRTTGSSTNSFDFLGLFDQFNNHTAVLSRLVTQIALVGPDTSFTLRVYLIMTLVFAFTTAGISLAVSSYASRMPAILVVFFLVFLPFSNHVMLAQANTVAWPLALYIFITTATGEYPNSVGKKTLLAVLSALVAMSSVTMILAIVFLVLNMLENRRTVHRYELVLLTVTCISFFVQWNLYTPRSNPKLPFLGELHKALYNFSPQYIRQKIGTSLNGDDQIIFWIIPLMLLIIWLTQVNFARQTNWSVAVSAAKLFVGGVVLLGLMVRGNGWFNTHYLFIPTAMFWVSLTLLFHQNRHDASTRLTVSITLALFATTYSGTYYLL